MAIHIHVHKTKDSDAGEIYRKDGKYYFRAAGDPASLRYGPWSTEQAARNKAGRKTDKYPSGRPVKPGVINLDPPEDPKLKAAQTAARKALR